MDIFDQLDQESAPAQKDIFDALDDPKELKRLTLSDEMSKARSQASTDELKTKLIGAAQQGVELLDPFKLLKRTLELPQQIFPSKSKFEIAPALSKETVRKGLDFLDPNIDEAGPSLREGVKQFASEIGSELTSPDQAAALLTAKVNPELAGRLFQTQAAGQIPSAAQELQQAAQSGDATDIGKAGAGLAASVAIPSSIEKGLRKAARVPKTDAAPTVTETTPPVPLEEMPTTPTETGFRPAIREVGGKVDVGDAGEKHVDIIKDEKLKAEDIDQRGFVGENGNFKDREQTAKATGVPTQTEPGRQHSTDLPEAGGVAPDQPEIVGMGGAASGELPDTGAGAEKYGIAQRVREERAQAGQVDPVSPGEGTNPTDSVEHGRALNASDPNLAEKLLTAFENDPNKSLSSNLVAATRARGEDLSAAARRIEQEKGTDSPEYQAAKKALSDWDKRTKPIQTEWHKAGVAQQGETDIDTGSYTGLERAYRGITGKDFTPEQSKQAKAIAPKVKQAESELEAAKDKLFDEVGGARIDQRVKSIAERIVAIMDKAGQDALSRIKARRAEGRLTMGLDPVDLGDHVIYGASKIAKGAIEFGQWSAEMLKDLGDYVKPELDKIWKLANEKSDKFVAENAPSPLLEKVKQTVLKVRNAEQSALDAANRTVREAAVSMADADNKLRVAKTAQEKAVANVQKVAAQKALRSAREVAKKAATEAAKKAREPKMEAVLDDQDKAVKEALDAANRAVTDAAAKLAESEQKRSRVASAKERAAANVQSKSAKKALESAQKTARQAAAKAAEVERKRMGDPLARVAEAINGYIDKGETDPATLFTKVASDLGMTTEKVHRLLTQNKRVKHLSDDMWRKAQTVRILKENARRWVLSADDPKLAQYLALVPQSMFKAKVFGHAGVAIGTHAPAIAWQLRYWPVVARNYYKMWQLATSSARYERMTAELQQRKNYTPAQRYGLKNRFSEHDEINSPPVFPWMEQQTKVGFGSRGYSVLKFLRQDLFDNLWDVLPKHQQTDEMGWIIANRVNHLTGTLSDVQPPRSLRMKGDLKLPSGASTVGFAPSLLVSRARVLFKDPYQSAKILTHWNDATPGEKMAVKMDISDRLWATGTMLSLLGINAGLLYANNSKQKINFTDPTRSDWLKFKAYGFDFAFGNALMSMGRAIPRLATQIAEEGGKRRKTYADEQAKDAVWQFMRSQLSPFLGTTLDLGLGADFQKRPLPAKLFGTVKQTQAVPLRLRKEGVKPYTWPEYGSQVIIPIPFQEGLKEVWKNGLGMSDKQIDGYIKAIKMSLIAGTTGGRISEDLAPPVK